MTTPQSQLYYLAEKVKELYIMFKGDGEEEDIFERIKQIELQMSDILASQQRQENLLNLIVKLLSSEINQPNIKTCAPITPKDEA